MPLPSNSSSSRTRLRFSSHEATVSSQSSRTWIRRWSRRTRSSRTSSLRARSILALPMSSPTNKGMLRSCSTITTWLITTTLPVASAWIQLRERASPRKRAVGLFRWSTGQIRERVIKSRSRWCCRLCRPLWLETITIWATWLISRTRPFTPTFRCVKYLIVRMQQPDEMITEKVVV